MLLAFAVLMLFVVTVGVMGVLVFIGVTVGVKVLVFIKIAVSVVGVLVVVIIAVGTRPVGFATRVPWEADFLLDLVEVVTPSHGVLQTQRRDLLNDRLHDKLDTEFHRRR